MKREYFSLYFLSQHSMYSHSPTTTTSLSLKSKEIQLQREKHKNKWNQQVKFPEFLDSHTKKLIV